jgi:photosystem II stability/assembly factor-like uncharacterized protein
MVLAVPSAARGNGRPAATVDVHVPAQGLDLLVTPATFGLLLSSDQGASFHWVCEDALGYGGTFDPDYEIGDDGAMYATSFDGLRRSTDGGCTWPSVGPFSADLIVNDVMIASGGEVWAAAASASLNGVYRSADGENFTRTSLERERSIWLSVRVADSDTNRAYVGGFQFPDPDPLVDGGASTTQPVLYRTLDGGTNWEELGTSELEFGSTPRPLVVGILPTEPDVLFVRSEQAINGAGDILYRSSDGGLSFSEVLRMDGRMRAFLVRRDGTTVIAGTADAGVMISTDAGSTWSPAPSEPRMACIAETDSGELFSCGANGEPDFYALGRSADAASWEKVFRFADIVGPLECAAGTVQTDTCAALWPDVAAMLGIGGFGDSGPGGSLADAGSQGPSPKGCLGCNSSGSVALFVLIPVLGRRRRRR